VAGLAEPESLRVLALATWLPRDAPNANAAVSAAAPPAAHPVMVLTRRRAPALSIAMPADSTVAVRLSEALSKRFV
jgi:hypothetical protein